MPSGDGFEAKVTPDNAPSRAADIPLATDHTAESMPRRSPIGRAVCYNQGEYIQYELLAADFHRQIEEFVFKHFGSGIQALLPLDPGDLEKITAYLPDSEKKAICNLCARFEEFLNVSFEDIVRKNFSLLHECFVERKGGNNEPRICVKSNKTEEDGCAYVFDLFRDDQSTPRVNFPIQENSGFLKIQETGTYYLCNDITALSEEKRPIYHSKRIDPERVIMYQSVAPKEFPDIQWFQCWNDWNSADEQLEIFSPHSSVLKSFYKSTLVIPITVTNAHFHHGFKNILHIEHSERPVFGYLCLDHVERNYFDERDIEIGYIFADLLSLYFVTRFEHVTLSWPYQFVRQLTSFLIKPSSRV